MYNCFFVFFIDPAYIEHINSNLHEHIELGGALSSMTR